MANQVLYGFANLEQMWDERVTEVGVSVVATAIQQSVDEHNRQLNALIALFADTTTEFKQRYQTTAVVRSQPLDDDGRARPIQVGGYYDIAFPLQMSGNAWGANYRGRAKMTVGEANRITTTLLEGDIRWMRDHILAALFTNVSWTYADPAHGNLTIKGLANGDTDTYQVIAGADQAATDDHYLAQANAISDTDDPFDAMYTELDEHPENVGPYVAILPNNLKSSVEGLTDFYPVSDPNIRLGSGQSELVGTLGMAVPGKVIGYHASGLWLVHWRSLPDNYMIAVAAGAGDRPLAMREEPESELRGFVRVAGRDDHPFYESQYHRYCGFGARNRVAALIQLIGNGTYSIPTNHGSPMP